jgi:CRP-like cAMP-binding protein
MQELIKGSNELAENIIDNLAGRVLHLVNLVEDLSLHSVESRLARMLLRTGETGVILRHRWTTQAEIAARLGTVPDVVNRALRKFVEEGLIELDRHQIRLLNKELLRSKAMIDP